MSETKEKTEIQEKENETKKASLLSLATELGFSIAIPIVVLAIAGRFADKYFGTSPLLLLIGILISIFLSSFIVYRKVIKIIK